MDLILGLIMAAVGILTVATGKLRVSADAVSTGAPARLAGVLLICALPATFLITVARRLVEQAVGAPILGESVSAFSSYAVLVVFGVAAVIVAKSRVGA